MHQAVVSYQRTIRRTAESIGQ
uniref:Uncharacterized protein n=1 Tax=Arundo donax TaxID=35708 RepID=A0A0A9FVN7_ARUDO